MKTKTQFRKRKLVFKVFAFLSVFLQVVFAYPAQAILVESATSLLGVGSFTDVAKEMMTTMEERYHLNQSSLQNYGENMNVSLKKSNAPQVMLFFNPTDPKPGEEITAEAIPSFFSGTKEMMYFTWYLKRAGCNSVNEYNSSHSKFPKPTGDLKDACDADDNGEVTENDWKVEAMRKIVQSGFIPCDQHGTETSEYDQCMDELYDRDDDGDGYSARFGGDKSANQFCYVHDFDSGENRELLSCGHLFPNDDIPSTRVGDGTFNKNEEKFWMTDTHDPSTAQNGNKDEANVVGLGQSKFKWNYTAGDEVGVVVEGTSLLPTKHDNASMMVMWAFPKNVCPVTGVGSYAKTIKGYEVTIPTANMDLNDCVRRNLVDPTQGDQAGRIDVQTTYFPENPVVDSLSTTDSDREGSILTVQSSLGDSATDPSKISYEWNVYANSHKNAGDDRAWDNITDDLQDEKAITGVKGSDLSALKINLNLDEKSDIFAKEGDGSMKYFGGDGIGYFRVSVMARENFMSGKTRIGRSSVVVKVIRSGDRLETRVVTVAPDGKLKLSSDTLCEIGSERSMCPVVKGQIVGATLSASAADDFTDFSWLLNGKPLRCEDQVSGSGGCRDGRENFFPVTGNVGEIYALSLVANNVDTGKTVTLNRIFTIVEPSIIIVSADEGKTVWPKWLGQYVDENGNATDDYSPNVFEAFSGGTFALKGMFYPSSLKNDASAFWLVDGNQAIPDGTTGAVSIAASKPAGSVYSVDLKGLYVPPNDIKKALHDIWSLSIADFNETTLTSDIQVELVQSVDGLAMGPLETSKKFFAAIVSYVPASVLFFFQLIVTMALILLVIGVAFSFAPEFASEKRRR